MKQFIQPNLREWVKDLRLSLLGAITFYTYVPLPKGWAGNFQRIARWAPLIGLIIGGSLSLIDLGFQQLGMPRLTRSAVIVAIWLAFTGGLHLDGAIDTADGLAVPEQERRLEVMKDSTTGAFGVMAATVILILKTVALSNIATQRWLALMASAAWSRWGQVWAIACFDYLKPQGKGAFHKQFIQLPQDILLGLLLLLSLSGVVLYLDPESWRIALGITIAGGTIPPLVASWFNYRLGGHTGDTYGAVVEWAEALLLCLLTSFLKG